MPETCKEKILSNDYADLIIDFELTEELLDMDTSNLDYCYRQIDRGLGLVFTRRNQVEPVGLLNYSYQRIPSLFGLQELTTESVGAGNVCVILITYNMVSRVRSATFATHAKLLLLNSVATSA